MKLTLKDKRELMQECGDAAMILFEFYVSKAGLEEYMYSDDKAAIALGWTSRKVQEHRKKLTKANYFFQQRGKYHSGTKIITTYLGKRAVQTIKNELEHYEKLKEK